MEDVIIYILVSEEEEEHEILHLLRVLHFRSLRDGGSSDINNEDQRR